MRTITDKSSPLTRSTSRAARLLLLLLCLFLAGFAALITVNLVIGQLVDNLGKRGDTERARLFVGEELVRTIKSIELDFNRMVASVNIAVQARLQDGIKEKVLKLEKDLMVMKDGGRVERIFDLNIEGVDYLNQQVTYTPSADDPHNLLELIEIGPHLDLIREKSDELTALLAKREQARENRNGTQLLAMEEELNLFFKHIPSLFIRLNENTNRLYYESNNRIAALEVQLATQRSTYKKIQLGLVITIVLLVMGSGVLLALQLTAVNRELAEQNRLLQEANRAAEAARLAAETSEHAKAESEQRWLFALEGSGDGVWDWDYPSGTVFYSRRFKEMLGYAEDEIGTGLNEWTDRVHPADRDAIRNELHRYLNGETPFYAGEFRMLCRDGSYRWILTRGMVVSQAADGSIVRIIGTHSDITTRKQAEEALHEQALMLEEEVTQRQLAQESLAVKQVQLQALNETLEARVAEELHKNREKDGILLQQDKLASIGQLAAGVAHEINNPMGFIMSNLRTLQKYTGVEQQYLQALEDVAKACCQEEQRKQLEELYKRLDVGYVLEDIPPLISESLEGAERVKRIVLDLKDFARSDENRLKETDLNQCVQSTVNIVFNEIKYVADLHLQLGNIPPIVCNPQQINQMITNMLMNAAQAIGDGYGHISVSTSIKGSHILLTVADTGCGIPDKILKRVFDPFFTTKEVGKGIGLGLSISYDIIKKHGGEITIESELGVGTTFIIRFPISGPKEITA